jgi:hypothetical protein
MQDNGELWMRYMRSGNWAAAWRLSDQVLHLRGNACGEVAESAKPRHLQAVWDGSELAGRRVLVRCYHGLGDTIQFIRFAPRLRQLARHVSVWAQPPLLPLLRHAAGVDELLPLHEGCPPLERDVDIELMELPHALRLSLDDLAVDVPYLNVAPKPLVTTPGQPNVGLVWQSGSWDVRRSVPMRLMQSLVKIPGITWYLMQRGPALADWAAPHCADHCVVPLMRDVMEEAATLRGLDLLITVDTMSAHLAGALAVPTWTLLPAESDWRWMEQRDDTPWYPTMRLFRQPPGGDWEDPFRRVSLELCRTVLTRSRNR